MLELITQRLQGLQQSGQWDQTMGEFKQRVIENSQRPAPVEGCTERRNMRSAGLTPAFA
jgi:conjugal transfer pilus assembly protein TraW